MRGEFSTSSVDQGQRLAYWNDLVCDVFVRLDCRAPGAGSFNASMRYGALGWLRVVEAESDTIEGVRSRAQISKGCEDDLLVSLQVGGETLLTQDGREAHLRPGEFAIYDSERPYKLRMTAGTQLVCLQFPRAQIVSRLGAIKCYVARSVRGDAGVGGLFAGLVRALPRRLSEIEVSDAESVADHVLDLLALSMSGTTRDVRALSSSKATTLARLKRIIRSHLRDPAFDPGRAAARAGMSRRHANRLLASEGTSLERFIGCARLERCHAALRDPAHDGQTIGEIAFAWGFNDLSHFSRAFRARYGCAPRDFRKSRVTAG